MHHRSTPVPHPNRTIHSGFIYQFNMTTPVFKNSSGYASNPGTIPAFTSFTTSCISSIINAFYSTLPTRILLPSLIAPGFCVISTFSDGSEHSAYSTHSAYFLWIMNEHSDRSPFPLFLTCSANWKGIFIFTSYSSANRLPFVSLLRFHITIYFTESHLEKPHCLLFCNYSWSSVTFSATVTQTLLQRYSLQSSNDQHTSSAHTFAATLNFFLSPRSLPLHTSNYPCRFTWYYLYFWTLFKSLTQTFKSFSLLLISFVHTHNDKNWTF